MYYRLLTAVCLLIFVIGCGEKKEPSKEVIKLQGMSSDDVSYSYDAIIAMSDTELDANITDLRERLQKKRSAMTPSAGGASVGGGETEAIAGDSENAAPAADDKDANVSIEYLALPFEVMKQVKEGRK